MSIWTMWQTKWMDWNHLNGIRTNFDWCKYFPKNWFDDVFHSKKNSFRIDLHFNCEQKTNKKNTLEKNKVWILLYWSHPWMRWSFQSDLCSVLTLSSVDAWSWNHQSFSLSKSHSQWVFIYLLQAIFVTDQL